MNNPEIILLKISICLTILFGIYYFLLRKETAFRFIRFYLLLSLAISVAFPFIPTKINWSPPEFIKTQVKKTEPSPSIEIIPSDFAQPQPETQIQQTTKAENKLPWILYIYFAGVIILTLRFIFNLLTLGWKILNKRLTQKGGFIFIDSSPEKNIHSFFNFIFLPKEQINKPINSVIEHEKSHAKQFHSLDILIIELLQIIFWFHPLIYFFKNAIVLNHEYLADEHAVKSGRTEYQQSLLEYCIENSQLQFISGFNFNHIKKRLAMMTKENRKQNYLKPLTSLILAGLLFTTLSLKEKDVSALPFENDSQIIINEPVKQEIEPVSNSFQEKVQSVQNEKELRKLLQKRDSTERELQFKYQTEMNQTQQRMQYIMQELQQQMNSKMVKAQNEMKEAQISAQQKITKFQQTYQNRRITPVVEKEYEEFEKKLSLELEDIERKLSTEIELLEDSAKHVIQSMEMEMEVKISEMELQMEKELSKIDMEIKLKRTQLEED